MRVRVPDVYRAYPTGYHKDLLPWGWESTTPPGWMHMLPHNLDGSLSGVRLGRYSGLSALGQCVDPESGESIDCVGVTPLPDIPLQPLEPLTIPNLPNLPANTPSSASYTTISTSGGDYILVNGVLFDPNGNVVSNIPSSVSITGTGATTQQQLTSILNSAANAALTATKIYQATQTPSLIPGTNLVYNPATGQLANAAGITAQSVAPIVSSLTPVLILGIGLVVVMAITGKH